MRQLLRLLLYIAAGAIIHAPGGRSSYFESAQTCGYTEQGFVHFEQSPELQLEPSLGICGWGFDSISVLRSRADLCLSCWFTPADKPTCRNGSVVVKEPVWHLAQQQDCDWQGCWLGGGICSNGTAVSTAVCPDGSINPKCCPFKQFVRCCRTETCTQRASPAGHCVVGQNDLRPGQQAVGRVFSVPTASTDCFPYSFEALRACQSDRTFAPDTLYASCDTRAVRRDADGCAVLSGYTFYRGWLLPHAASWRVDDGTHWELVEGGAEARAAAARDMPLMASRCSALSTCAAFQNTGNSTDLLYQLPVPSSWVRAPDSADYCTGVYAKSAPSTVCPRVAGYLFMPLYTLNTNVSGSGFIPAAAPGSTSSGNASTPCADCADANALAVQCDGYGSSGSGSGFSCAGFSNYHGLILTFASSASASATGPLTDAPLSPFTSTPCAGLFTRAGRVFPSEVEELDRLLCGEMVYCTSQLRYHASGTSVVGASGSSAASSSYYVDLSVEVLTDLTLPRGLLDATGGGLRSLPTVRSLVVRCRGGASLLGGLPVGVVALMPVLQELRVVGCGVSGELPGALAQLRYLRVLDLNSNSLSGSLPEAWANMSLGYLNLSSNLLTGTLPAAWLGILSPPLPSPPLPPPFVLSAAAAQVSAPSPPPPPPPPKGGAASMLVADLSGNALTGAVPRDFVESACVDEQLRMQLRGDPSGELLAAVGSGRPTFLLQGNPGVASWAGRYEFAVADLGGALHGGGYNLCGANGYKIALGVVWGVFGACLLAIAAFSIAVAVRESRRQGCSRGLFSRGGFMTEANLALVARATDGADSDADSNDSDGGTATGASRVAALLDRLWAKRWVRRLTLLARVGYLAADVALDIRVTVWLFADDDVASSAVCLAFVAVTQAAVSAALWGSLAHHLFASRLTVAAVSPLLLLAGPLVGPVLAVANISNPDVPVVFWRYLELVEFCVALLQAPAEAVTQSVVYARQNRMGAGMYLDHALFLASILLSLGDILIAAWKLCRYKRGPVRRVLVAITHIDKVRDPLDYRKRLRGPYSGEEERTSGFGGDGSGLHYLETPLNPAGGGRGQSSGSTSGSQHNADPAGSRETSRERLSQLSLAAPSAASGAAGSRQLAAGSMGGARSSGGGVVGLKLQPAEHTGPMEANDGPDGGAAVDDGRTSASTSLTALSTSTAATSASAGAAAHTFTPLTQSRYRPSLLAASASRLGGGGTGGGGPGGGAGGVAMSHSQPAPSRLGPGSAGGGRHSVTIPACPPLRPLLPSLPATPPHPPSRNGTGGAATEAEGDRASPTAHSRHSLLSTAAAMAAAAVAAEEERAARQQGEEQQLRRRSQDASSSAVTAAAGVVGATASQRGSGGGSLSRRSRSVQEGLPPQPLDALASSLMGSLSSGAGFASTGGHGPPRAAHRPAPGIPAAASSSSSSGMAQRRSGGSNGGQSGGHSSAGSGPAPPLSGPLHSGELRYLASAASAAEAALAEAAEAAPQRHSGGGGPPSGPSPGGPAPAGLIHSPSHRHVAGASSSSRLGGGHWREGGGGASGGRASSGGAASSTNSSGDGGPSLRQVASIREASPHSSDASPARRRLEPLSIAVPRSSVQGAGIEVIRVSSSRAGSVRQESPTSSHGGTTPLTSVRLPPPPQPPPWLAGGVLPPIPPRPPRPPEG